MKKKNGGPTTAQEFIDKLYDLSNICHEIALLSAHGLIFPWHIHGLKNLERSMKECVMPIAYIGLRPLECDAEKIDISISCWPISKPIDSQFSDVDLNRRLVRAASQVMEAWIFQYNKHPKYRDYVLEIPEPFHKNWLEPSQIKPA